MISVRGRWAFITGASRGIGLLCATALAADGCNIVVHSRSLAHTAGVADMAARAGVGCVQVAADLGSGAEVEAMLAQVDAAMAQRQAHVDLVLNNAGVQVAYRNNYFLTPATDFATSFAVNTTAPMLICYHFLPLMLHAGFGRIVNTTSGINREPQQAGYSASKAALDKVTADLASTLSGSGVLLSLVDPGWCRTDLGGPNAPNDPRSALPGALIGIYAEGGINGRTLAAQDYAGLTLAQAVQRAEAAGRLG